MAEDDVEETNSGVKKKGSWNEIVEFGEEVENALEQASDQSSVEKFGDWRPQVEESESDVKRKTVDKAVIDENRFEESEGVTRDLRQASGKVAEAGKKAANRETPEEEIIEASEDAAKPFYSNIAKLFRKIESWIYSAITLRFNPYYLDTGDFSVDIRDRKDGEFEMDVSVPEEQTREELKDSFREGE